MPAPNRSELSVVILGAGGFVGSAVLRAMCHFESAQLVAYALFRSAARGEVDSRRVHASVGDLEHLQDNFFPRNPHVIIHLATKQIDRDGKGFGVNIENTLRLMEALPETTRGIVYGSSASVYGPNRHVDVDELTPVRPTSTLARARHDCERLIMQTASKRRIFAYCLRPRFLFGTGDRHTLPALVRLVRLGVRLGDGNQRFTIMDVDDYAYSLLHLSRQILSGNTPPEQVALNTGYSRTISMNEINSAICSRYALKEPRMHVPVRPWITSMLNFIPAAATRNLATKIELVGYSHTFSVDCFRTHMPPHLINKDPRHVIAASHLVQEPQYAYR